jgi:hypothetical protein
MEIVAGELTLFAVRGIDEDAYMSFIRGFVGGEPGVAIDAICAIFDREQGSVGLHFGHGGDKLVGKSFYGGFYA